MQGFDPVTEKPIRPAGSNGTRVAAIDVSYAPPKEVSALWATTDPYRRAQIEVAHRKAVASALKRIEREVALVRRKTNGVVRYEKAEPARWQSRPCTRPAGSAKDQDEHGIPDPQLHSHVAMIAAERKDGVIAAVESKQLYAIRPRERRLVPRELAENLQELGVGIERHQGNGERYFGVRGVSKDLSERWSTRTQDVHRAANLFRQRYGREPGPGELDSLTLVHPRVEDRRVPGGGQRRVACARRGAQPNPAALRGSRSTTGACTTSPTSISRRSCSPNVTREASMINTHELHAKAYELSAGVVPARGGRPARQRPHPLGRAAPVGGRHVDHTPAPRAGAGHDRDRQSGARRRSPRRSASKR